MLRPKLYLLGPGQYSYRVNFRFIDAAGKLLLQDLATPPRATRKTAGDAVANKREARRRQA